MLPKNDIFLDIYVQTATGRECIIEMSKKTTLFRGSQKGIFDVSVPIFVPCKWKDRNGKARTMEASIKNVWKQTFALGTPSRRSKVKLRRGRCIDDNLRVSTNFHRQDRHRKLKRKIGLIFLAAGRKCMENWLKQMTIVSASLCRKGRDLLGSIFATVKMLNSCPQNWRKTKEDRVSVLI